MQVGGGVLVPIQGVALQALLPWVVERCNMPRIAERLQSGTAYAYHILGTDAALILTAGETADSHIKALWIASIGGSGPKSPKKNAALLTSVLQDCETLAKASECLEIRIEANNRTNMKMRLFQRLGFAPGRFHEFQYLRKAV